MDKLQEITEKLKDRKYISVDEEEEYMQYIYNSVIGDVEESMFLTPNWIAKKEKENEKVEGQVSNVRMSRYGRDM